MTELEFLALIESHRRTFFRLCRLYRDNDEDRKDLYQDIVYELWRCRDTVKDQSNINTWLYSVAFHVATAIYHSKKPRMVPLSFVQEDPEMDGQLGDNRDRLFQAMKRLDEEEKSLLTLYMEQLSYEEIAAILKITVSHVGVKLHRVKIRIRKFLNREECRTMI